MTLRTSKEDLPRSPEPTQRAAAPQGQGGCGGSRWGAQPCSWTFKVPGPRAGGQAPPRWRLRRCRATPGRALGHRATPGTLGPQPWRMPPPQTLTQGQVGQAVGCCGHFPTQCQLCPRVGPQGVTQPVALDLERGYSCLPEEPKPRGPAAAETLRIQTNTALAGGSVPRAAC